MNELDAYKLLVIVFINLLCVHCYIDMDHLNSKAIYLESKVGGHVIMACPLEFPQEVLIPYVLHWNKDVSYLRYCKILCKLS